MFEMLAAGFVEKLADARQLFDHRLVFRNFAVKNAQGICYRAALAIHAHLVFNGIEGLAQSFVVSRAVVGAAD